MSRTRTTWATADRRRASAPPANPGYGVEDQQHPAHYPDPEYAKYKKGDPSAWAEDVHQPPYPEGNPPAIPGYDVEDQQHPAHKKNPRVPKEANLRAQVEAKAAKCLRLAQAMFSGKRASESAIEDQALDLMDLPMETINASLDRLGGGFLAMDPDMDEGPFMGMDMDMDDGFGGMGEEEELFGMGHMADQNVYPGPTQGPGAQTEQAERAEQVAISNGETTASRLASQVFASYDTDGDGFVTIDEWKGNKALFAAIDTDLDGVISRSEFVALTAADDEDDEEEEAEEVEAKKKAGGSHDLYSGLDPEESAMLAAMQDEMACGQVMASDDDEDDDEEEEVEAKKKAARIAQLRAELYRLAGDDDEDDDEEEDEEVEAKKKAARRLAQLRGLLADDEEDSESEDEDDAESKEAAAYFATVADPMGLADGAIHMSAEEKATLEGLFEMDTPASTTASLEDVLNPKPRQASEGVRQLGSMTRKASGGGLGDLANLWDSKPNVDEHYGM